ncbi:hypothetical protein D0T53_04050 [Dysgonomonas sp. 216]|uniref:VanZ family protein n=1 Tax=Dysgonomonas sp. 216 TaxID=2302934 RepID=UPI0013D09785|nr:VanZ family protein [Dysgonomonas sp. 216]NDW18090.1 hypothetical protein [Dysgonomonas sp. 216]
MLRNVLTSFFRYGWVPLLISLTILYLCCFISGDDIPEVEMDFFIPFDKIVHFIMYFGLSAATAFYYIYINNGYISKLYLILGVIIYPILYGGFIEIIQSLYFPPRSGDWFDFIADALGVFAALPVIYYFRRIFYKRNLAI